MEDYFSRLPGVTGTTAGYAGGTTDNPTYTNIDGHTETVEIVFDPDTIPYEELLNHFWRYRDPTYRFKTQYISAIFTHGDAQLKTALASRDIIQKNYADPLVTRIEAAGPFWPAEDYHQKYVQKHRLC